MQQAGKVRICLTNERQDIAVNQSLHKPGTLYAGKYGNENADHNENAVNRIVFHDVGEQTHKQFARIFNLWAWTFWTFAART